jgi:hypothetical protein
MPINEMVLDELRPDIGWLLSLVHSPLSALRPATMGIPIRYHRNLVCVSEIGGAGLNDPGIQEGANASEE